MILVGVVLTVLTMFHATIRVLSEGSPKNGVYFLFNPVLFFPFSERQYQVLGDLAGVSTEMMHPFFVISR